MLTSVGSFVYLVVVVDVMFKVGFAGFGSFRVRDVKVSSSNVFVFGKCIRPWLKNIYQKYENKEGTRSFDLKLDCTRE
jgi:hypothetical protein